MRPSGRRRIARACRLMVAVIVAEAAALALLVAVSQPVRKLAWRPGMGIVYDRPLAKTVIEVPTGRTWAVAPDGAETLVREGD